MALLSLSMGCTIFASRMGMVLWDACRGMYGKEKTGISSAV